MRNRDSSSSEPNQPRDGNGNRGGHRRNASSSHLVKQLAPYNKSPDLDRHKRDDMEDDLDSDEGENGGEDREETVERRGRRSQPRSRRGTLQKDIESRDASTHERNGNEKQQNEWEGAEGDRAGDHRDEDHEMADEHQEVDDDRASPPGPDQPPELEPDLASNPEAEELPDADEDPGSPAPEPVEEQEPVDGDGDDDVDDEDPDGPGPKYCYCNRGSYGEMVACDNDECPREWFHLGCTELREAPDEDETWYCKECRPLFVKRGKGGLGRGGAKAGR